MIEDLNSFDYDDYACSCFLNVNLSDVFGDIGDIFMFIYHDRFGYVFFALKRHFQGGSWFLYLVVI